MSFPSPSYRITEYKVMQSNAGFYIGRGCFPYSAQPDFEQPYDRVSGYFPTAEAAKVALERSSS